MPRIAAFGVALSLVFGCAGIAGADPIDLDIRYNDPPFNVTTTQITGAFQSGDFVIGPIGQPTRPDSGWENTSYGWVRTGFVEPAEFHIALNLFLVPPGSPPVPTTNSGPPYPNAPEISYVADMKGSFLGDDSPDVSGYLKASSLQIYSSNLAGAVIPQSLINTFTDPSRIQITEDVTGGTRNELEIHLTILPPSPGAAQSVPEPASYVLFVALAGYVVLTKHRRAARQVVCSHR